MSPLTKALLLSWDLRLEILVPLVVLGALHFVGWLRLRARSRGRFANGWRLGSYTAGLLVLALALLSPLEVISAQLFSIHMVQHLLLVMIAPPLLLLANPLPTFLWAFPSGLRIAFASTLRQGRILPRMCRKTTGPGIAWLLYLLFFFGWHDGNAYSLALRSEALHSLEHISFLGAALLFWWHVTGVGPRIHAKLALWMRAGYVLAMIPPNMLLGVALSFAKSPVYPYYETVPRLYGLSVMDDQIWGGLIMWIPGSMMYVMAALVLLARLFMGAEQETQARYSKSDQDLQKNSRRLGLNPVTSFDPEKPDRKSVSSRTVSVCLLLIVHCVLLPGRILAHGGVGFQHINNEPAGPYRVYIWSDPEPPQVGEYHVAVALTENIEGDATGLAGGPVLDADVTVEMVHQENGTTLIEKATHDDALNKLFYQASFAPATRGIWDVQVRIVALDGQVAVGFEDEILPKPFPWRALLGGLLSVVLLVGAFVLYWKTQPQDAPQPVQGEGVG